MIKGAIYQGRVRTVEDAVEVWKSRHDDAMAVRDIEDIVRESVSAFEVLFDWQRESWEFLRAGKIKRILDYGGHLGRGFRIGLDLAALVQGCVDWAEMKGYSVDNAFRFRDSVTRLGELRGEFLARWPFPNKEEIERGLAAVDRGEGTDLGELINELQGQQTPASTSE
jgi:hypothetical protein